MDNAQLQELRIAVTGADGFIGRAFVERLRSLDISAITIKGDVRMANTWNEKFDVLYHFAAKMPAHFAVNAQEAFDVNINGVLNALDACRRNKTRMVFTSTCGLYKPSAKAFAESDVLEPPTAYTQSKLIGEMLCQSYAKQYDVPTTVLRLFNVYGPGQDESYIIAYLIKCALEGTTAQVHHPDSSRDFVHLDDVVDAFVGAATTREPWRVYNVGSGKSHTIAQVVGIINQACEKNLEFRSTASQADPQPVVCADVSRIAQDLGWSAKISLEQGIRGIVQSCVAKI